MARAAPRRTTSPRGAPGTICLLQTIDLYIWNKTNCTRQYFSKTHCLHSTTNAIYLLANNIYFQYNYTTHTRHSTDGVRNMTWIVPSAHALCTIYVKWCAYCLVRSHRGREGAGQTFSRRVSADLDRAPLIGALSRYRALSPRALHYSLLRSTREAAAMLLRARLRRFESSFLTSISTITLLKGRADIFYFHTFLFHILFIYLLDRTSTQNHHLNSSHGNNSHNNDHVILFEISLDGCMFYPRTRNHRITMNK